MLGDACWVMLLEDGAGTCNYHNSLPCAHTFPRVSHFPAPTPITLCNAVPALPRHFLLIRRAWKPDPPPSRPQKVCHFDVNTMYLGLGPWRLPIKLKDQTPLKQMATK